MKPFNIKNDNPNNGYSCKKTKTVLDSLSDDEIEWAAKASYDYIRNQTEENKKKFASELAKKYLIWCQNDTNEAIKFLKENIEFRSKMQLDQLVTAPTNRSSNDYRILRQQIGQKTVYVSGYDKDGRSTYYFIPRNSRDHHKEYTKKLHLWSFERAIACSRSTDQSINAVVDFTGFNPKHHAPPVAIGKDLLQTLSTPYYSNHINNIFLLDAPAPFVFMWSMVFKHCINRKTASKIHFVQKSKLDNNNNNINNRVTMSHKPTPNNKNHLHRYSTSGLRAGGGRHWEQPSRRRISEEEDRISSPSTKLSDVILQELYASDQMPSWIMPTGTKNRELDIEEYLDKIPFNRAFDDY